MTGKPLQVVNKGITPATKDVFGLATSGPTASLPPRPQAGSAIRPPRHRLRIPNHQIHLGMALRMTHLLKMFCATPSQPKQNFTHLISLCASICWDPVFSQPQQAQSFERANQHRCRVDIEALLFSLFLFYVSWPPKPVAPSHAKEKQWANQQNGRVLELEKHLVKQLSTEEVNSLN
ncbi:hypothetical protein DVH24_007861 [Malus domestica]|uniref:Uncharacterized protein n=1 Tax=Malus domestica TaxID=3750 RepID=A0A498JQU2_MALDO|nr:hypothetical protein DVH24_007861 [Malus domestica]